MATKKELAKALDIVEDALEAKDDKAVEKVVAASDKFESETKDKELAEKVDELVNKVVDEPVKTDTVEEVKDEAAPERVRRSEEEIAAWRKDRLKTVTGRVQIPD